MNLKKVIANRDPNSVAMIEDFLEHLVLEKLETLDSVILNEFLQGQPPNAVTRVEDLKDHPIILTLDTLIEFCSIEDIVNLFLINSLYKVQTQQVLEYINRPFEAQLKGFKPLEATAILSYSEQFLKDNDFVDANNLVDVNKKINRGKDAIVKLKATADDFSNISSSLSLSIKIL